MALASSVLPTPAGPSPDSGVPSRSARKTVVAIWWSGRYPAADSRVVTSATSANWAACVGVGDMRPPSGGGGGGVSGRGGGGGGGGRGGGGGGWVGGGGGGVLGGGVGCCSRCGVAADRV